jgi:hypothetical protein
VQASTGQAPEPSDPSAKRERVAELLARAGYPSHDRESLLAAVDAWRRARAVPMASIKPLGAAVIAWFDQLTASNVLPHLPAALHSVPRANIRFLPIKDAWFSGSMNYLGRARKSDGAPEYEATYEINASLEISVPEFLQLVSHEVVPGHVTTFAYLQNLYVRGAVGFEASVLTMNTRAAALFEGIANNAILMAHGVTEVDELPDEDLQIGVCSRCFRTTPRTRRRISPGTTGRRKPRWRRCCATSFWSPRSARTSCRARGDATPCWGGCICPPIAPEPRKSPACAAATRRTNCSPFCTAAPAWWM